MGAITLDGKATRDEIFVDLKQRVAALTAAGRTPGLGTILVGEDPGSQAYVRGKHADCAKVGITSIRRDLPADINGVSRIRRAKEVIWEKPFLSGEQNMAHSIANLEAHHFKYDLFRRPGDVHVHFFGTATLSFSDGVKPEKGDIFEIEAEAFGLPLRNRLTIGKAAKLKMRAL